MANFSLNTGAVLLLEHGADGNPLDEDLVLLLDGGTACGGPWLHIEVLMPERLAGRRLNFCDGAEWSSDQDDAVGVWRYDWRPQSDDGYVINGPIDGHDDVDIEGDDVPELHGLWLSEFDATSVFEVTCYAEYVRRTVPHPNRRLVLAGRLAFRALEAIRYQPDLPNDLKVVEDRLIGVINALVDASS
jgi:hypothetical protein